LILTIFTLTYVYIAIREAFMGVALVTGGTRGLGASISTMLAQQGFTVVAIYKSNLLEAAAFSKRTGCHVRCWDVSESAQCIDGVEEVEREIGPCTVLINNAGITQDSRVERMTDSKWVDVLSTNIGGCFNMSRAVFGSMRQQKFGRLVHLSSVVSKIGGIGISNYIASKSAIEGLSRALACEGAPYGITSNVVAPGYCDAGMIDTIPKPIVERLQQSIPIGRLGRPDEVAHAVSYLAHDLAGFVTGITLPVNGGMHMF
jgi:acetoacetyl-CoA reductase